MALPSISALQSYDPNNNNAVPCQLSQLPPTILEKIFSFLPETLAVPFVNRAWKHALDEAKEQRELVKKFVSFLKEELSSLDK